MPEDKKKPEVFDRPTMELPAGYKVDFPPVPSAGMPGFWECPNQICGFVNAEIRPKCLQCDTPKPV